MAEHRRLQQLARALEVKYPGLSITAKIDTHPSRSEPFRSIEFQGPRSLLVEFGLSPSDGKFNDVVDEFGTRIVRGRDYVIHVHDIVQGECGRRTSRRHPDNAKTHEVVARILARVSKAAVDR
jgi:hypothetical protein